MAKKTIFVDIMEKRRIRGDVFRYMSKNWTPTTTFNLEKKYSPQELKDTVANSVYIDAYLEAESVRSGLCKNKLKTQVIAFLEEMGLEKKLQVIRWMGILFLKISLMMKIQVFVNETAVFYLKSGMGKNPVLFLPTHRSYADFCLLTYLCYHYNIDFPAVAAGMDFYSMAVLGRCMRDTCAYYIRRTLAGSPLYAATLSHYVRTVVAKHCAPIEFFVEGTRSRTNKCLSPKYGMLAMSLVPLFAGEVSDITVVPINISYDRLMEQKLFAYELLGVPKPKESTGGFLKAIRGLNDNYGNIYINFGSPMSVRDYIKDTPLISTQTRNPIELQQLTAEQFLQVQSIADHVVSLLQSNSVVTISSLLALVITEYLIKNKALKYEDLVEEMGHMMIVLEGLGASMFTSDMKASVDRILVVHDKLVRIDNKDGGVKLISDPPINITEEFQNKMKGHVLKPVTMMYALPWVQVQLYVNPVLHYLIPPALVYRLVANGSINKEQLSSCYFKIRKLLKQEYFYSENNENLILEKAVDYCIQNNIIVQTGDTFTVGHGNRSQLLLSWCVWPALTTLGKAIEVLVESVKCDYKTAIKRIQERVEALHPMCHPYCLTLELITNCLHGLAASHALLKDNTKNGCVYEIVPGVIEEYRHLISSMLPYFDVDFSSNNFVIVNPSPCRL